MSHETDKGAIDSVWMIVLAASLCLACVELLLNMLSVGEGSAHRLRGRVHPTLLLT